MSMIKIEEDWLFLLAQREKGRRIKMWSRQSTGSKGTTSGETENSSLKLCIENMLNNTCSNNYITQWFPNCEPRFPWEPEPPPRGAANYYNFSQFYLLFITLFQFAAVDILQSIIHLVPHAYLRRQYVLCV